MAPAVAAAVLPPLLAVLFAAAPRPPALSLPLALRSLPRLAPLAPPPAVSPVPWGGPHRLVPRRGGGPAGGGPPPPGPRGGAGPPPPPGPPSSPSGGAPRRGQEGHLGVCPATPYLPAGAPGHTPYPTGG